MVPNKARSRRFFRRLCGAFTLIEMLVVLAIIGTLAAMLLPALARARETSRRAACANNLNQIGQAIAIYCSSTGDYLPSWANPGSMQGTVRASGDINNPFFNYTGHEGPSRHMVIGYSYACPQTVTLTGGGTVTVQTLASSMAPGYAARNFMPVGLGLLIPHGDVQEPRIFDCPDMRTGAWTYYGPPVVSAGPVVANPYYYDPGVWSKLSANQGSADQMFLIGDGTQLYDTPITPPTTPPSYVAGILSSYAYRDTPFYYPNNGLRDNGLSAGCALNLDNPNISLQSIGQCIAPLDSVVPVVYPRFMCPAFPTRRTLGNRAICSDTFDYSYNPNWVTLQNPPVTGGFKLGQGLATLSHKDGYNVLYGDNHVVWYDDTNRDISSFNRWSYSYTDVNGNNQTALSQFGVDDLTIASPTSQLVWNLFDRAEGIDVHN